MAIRSPVIRLNNVLLPTFGRPTIVTIGFVIALSPFHNQNAKFILFAKISCIPLFLKLSLVSSLIPLNLVLSIFYDSHQVGVSYLGPFNYQRATNGNPL